MTSELQQGKRHEKRDSLFLSASVDLEGFEPFTTRVRNLSAGGMMIDAPLAIPSGATLTAELRGVGKVTGCVAWSSLGRAGIAFDREIDPRLARSASPAKSELPVYLKPVSTRRTGLTIR